MGIPKFFRYISERYPLTSQLIQGDKIPEFDNFYLDFNGIIHNCSHPNDADAHFRMSEEQIFTSIFAYVDHLFSKIRPRKLFFMAVDGVAPRAKMNQQRSRRFRTAKEAGEVREKALRAGEKLPDEKAFDSNCITPGTPFMARLSEQLHYFVNKKITEDANWRDVKVVLSGHSVPGEGEHKIMEYIRLSRAQEDYNPNIRHCLYGLDADLMMLGLLSHDPHFCLLREEVKFGPASKKKSTPNLESQTFFLLHLSLLREYLDLEFKSVESILPFPYDLERIIDDFVLLAVFVGNDFLPHLPDFHIHDNALERLFDIYKNVLPKMGGYLNMNGTIDTSRLQTIMEELSLLEQETFEKENADMNWYHGKQVKHTHSEADRRRQETGALSQAQSEIFKQVKAFIEKNDPTSTLPMANTFPARDREFIKKISSDLGLLLTWDEYNEDDENVVTFRLPVVEDAERDEESRFAIERVLNKYSKLDVAVPDLDGYDLREKERTQKRVDQWKRSYYREKLELSFDNPEELDALVYRYVEGLQWVMYYYYSGVASWGWFYNYHFSPRISDLVGIAQFQFSFELGTPFRPFEQLMGVLPEASKEHIPEAYRDLMSDPNSPILDFYPAEFEQDMNGKKQEWEAVVKIPFIDESRLLRAMQMREHRLTPEERSRNGFGSSTMFTYNAGHSSTYPSSLPGFFPDLHHCTCEMVPFDLPTLDGLHLVPGLLDGVSLGAAALAGFPSLCTLPHRAELVHHSVNVFQADSRNKSIVIYITDIHKNKSTADVAREVVGKRTFIDWPFLREGLVVAVSDSLFRHEIIPSAQNGQARSTQVVANPHSPQAVNAWQRKAERIEETYSKRCGVIIGPVDTILHVIPLKGLKRVASGALVKDYESQDKEVDQPAQTSVQTVISEDARFMERAPPPLREEFPEGSKVFFLGEHAYGVAAQVSETTETTLSVVLAFFPAETAENERFSDIASRQIENTYHVSYQVSQRLGISGLALAKITSSFMVILSDGQKVNLGLSIKFEAKGMKVINYSRKDGKAWEFSDQAVALLQDYKDKHPEVFKALDRRGDAMTLAHEMFPSEADRHVRDVKAWLKSRGAGDFEPVSLMCDQLKKGAIQEIEKLADSISDGRTPSKIKKAVVKGIPRQAVLKPAHSIYKLQNQHFALGDRVVMVQDTGSVPLGAKGIVVGLDSMSMEVVWDVAFMSGTTLGNRCSQYRGLAVGFDSCLNLTNPQYIMSKNTAGASHPSQVPFKPQFGPRPAVRPRQNIDRSTTGVDSQNAPTHIMSNPNRISGSRSTENTYNAVTAGVVQPREHSETLRDALKYGGRGSVSSNGMRRGHHGTGMQQQQQRGRGRGATVPLQQHNGRGGPNLTGPTPGPSRGHPDRGRPFPNRGLRGRGKVAVAQTE